MRKLILGLAATALLTTAPAASAATLTVTGGKLDWTMPNNYVAGDSARTWLGYITNTVGGPAASAGTAAVTAPSTLTGPSGAAAAIVDTNSARGLAELYTFGYPVAPAAGTYTEEGVGSVELQGTVTFTTHNIPVTVVDPLITLNGLTGTLKASGVGASQMGQPFTYDRTNPTLNLDLSAATVSLRADGWRVISGIKPTSAPGSVLSASIGGTTAFYGTMTLTLGLDYPEPGSGPQGAPGAGTTGATGPQGPVGPKGPAGPRGATGKSAKISSYTLKTAPFAGSAKRSVKLLQRKTGKVLATGTVQGRKLRLSHLSSTKLKGSYVLRVANGKRKATITIR